MSPRPRVTPGDRHRATLRLRASHADRELAVDILRTSAGDGRLTAAELDQRLETALTARTIGELAALTADLPGGCMLRTAGRGYDDEDPDDVAGAGTGVVPQPTVILIFLTVDRGNPAQVTRQDPAAAAVDPAASRWEFLRSLVASDAGAATGAPPARPAVS